MRVALFFIILPAGLLFSQDWQTYYEKSGFKKTPRYNETIEYCKKLAEKSPFIEFSSFGKSPQGRDLPLLIVNKEKDFYPKNIENKNHLVVLFQAGIHAGEIEGKDAGLMLLRDIFITDDPDAFPDSTTFLFIPIFNVDGHERYSAYNRINQNGPEEMGWRTTAQNYNLNRDYLKADTPEMRALLGLFKKWNPDFYIDSHTTNGADYQYVITYNIDYYGIMERNLSSWVRNKYLAALLPAMKNSGYPAFEYVSFNKRHQPQSGITAWIPGPRYSNGYGALRNRPTLLIETHMFKPYKQRVEATYFMIKYTLNILKVQRLQLKTEIAGADSVTADPNFIKNILPLKFSVNKQDSSIVKFKGFKNQTVKSDITERDWVRYSGDTVTYEIAFYNKSEIADSVFLPAAYIIPPEWNEIIERLDAHGIEYFKTKKDQLIDIESYFFINEKFQENPYEGRHLVKTGYNKIKKKHLFIKGSAVIPLNQPLAKLTAHIFEPKGPDSFIRWGFFNTIFERKEYFEDYVMEERIRFMLAGDENLKREFENKMQKDSTFAADGRAILLWFYKKSPYWDKKKNVYPVGRIMNFEVVDKLKE